MALWKAEVPASNEKKKKNQIPGYITKEQFLEVTAKSYFAAADKNGDHQIGFDEFIASVINTERAELLRSETFERFVQDTFIDPLSNSTNSDVSSEYVERLCDFDVDFCAMGTLSATGAETSYRFDSSGGRRLLSSACPSVNFCVEQKTMAYEFSIYAYRIAFYTCWSDGFELCISPEVGCKWCALII